MRKTLLICSFFWAALLISNVAARKGNKGRSGKNGGAEDGINNSTEVSPAMECLGQKLETSKLNLAHATCSDEVMGQIPAALADNGRARRKFAKKNQMCIKLCQRKHQGILDDEGKFSEPGTSRFVDDLFPEKARPRIQRGLKRCAEDHEETFETVNKCRNYKRFEKCIIRVISKNCGMKKGKMNINEETRRHGGNKNKKKPHNHHHHEIIDEDRETN